METTVQQPLPLSITKNKRAGGSDGKQGSGCTGRAAEVPFLLSTVLILPGVVPTILQTSVLLQNQGFRGMRSNLRRATSGGTTTDVTITLSPPRPHPKPATQDFCNRYQHRQSG